MHQATRTPKLVLLALTAAALATSACSGGDGDDAAGTTAIVESGGEDSSGSDGGTGASTPTAAFSFDGSALTDKPLAAGVLTLHGESANGGVPAPATPDALVDSCAAIDAATVSTIVSEADSSGTTYSFTSKAEGATCLFQDDTHLIGVTVQRPDVLDEAYIESRNSFGGEISSREAGGATLSFDDAFGIVTFFAVRAASSDFAVVVTNDGGTGVLGFEEEEIGWQRLAETALAGAPSAGPPSAAAGAAGELAPTNVCSAFEIADLNAAFDAEFIERVREPGTCIWATSDEVIWVRMSAIRLGTTADDYFELVDAGDGVFSDSQGLETYGLDGNNTFRVSVEVTTDRYGLAPMTGGLPDQVDATPIAEQMVRNLLNRFGA